MILAKLYLLNSLIEQYDKCIEEFSEFVESKSLDEAIDCIQALKGFIEKHSEEEIEEAYKNHIKKLSHRQHTGEGYMIEKYETLVERELDCDICIHHDYFNLGIDKQCKICILASK